jgi:hypothetical protein
MPRHFNLDRARISGGYVVKDATTHHTRNLRAQENVV